MASRNNTSITASNIFDLNALGYVQFGIGLGTVLAEPKNLKDKNWDQTSTDENFQSYMDYHLKGGGTAVGTTAAVNVFITASQNRFERTNLGAGQTLFAPVVTSVGLDLDGDQANDKGFALTMGFLANYAKHVWTTGTNKFYFETKITITDVSETDTLCIGLRKAEAHQANYDDYDEACFINVNAGNVIWGSILNNAATDNVDTTLDVADTQYIITRWEYDHTKGLSSSTTLANEMKRQYNLHLAKTSQHTAGADAANLVTVADATDLTTLIALITQFQTKIAAHFADAALGANWIYHAAQRTTAIAAFGGAPTDYASCVIRINEIKTKFKTHDDDTTAHGVATQFPVGIGFASSVTFKYGINTATLTTYTNSLKGFSFDDAEVVVPFIQFLHSAGSACNPVISSWKTGLL